MTDAPIDLKQLAHEAAQSVYSPRAQACWFPWSHRWTMWTVKANELYPAIYEVHRRSCVRCGKPRVKRVPV
jgi:hypothetical protein